MEHVFPRRIFTFGATTLGRNYLFPFWILKMGMEIQKDELIQFHSFLLHVRNYLECIEKNCDQDVFSSYDSLNIAPQQINRSKDEQKLAVFELCKGISEMVMVEDSSTLRRICKNLEKRYYARFR